MTSSTIYKYVPMKHAEALVQRGEVLFRSLLYFQACEDARADEIDGTRQYEPTQGLDINNHTQRQRQHIRGGSFRASIKKPSELFVFCTSTVLSAALAEKFDADACVEIREIDELTRRIRTALRRNPRVKGQTFVHGPVTYYGTEQPPGVVWALPEQIVMHKRRKFEDEQEYRFAFSFDRDAFRFEGAALTITTGPTPKVPVADYAQLLLRLGSLGHLCTIHRFDARPESPEGSEKGQSVVTVGKGIRETSKNAE